MKLRLQNDSLTSLRRFFFFPGLCVLFPIAFLLVLPSSRIEVSLRLFHDDLLFSKRRGVVVMPLEEFPSVSLSASSSSFCSFPFLSL